MTEQNVVQHMIDFVEEKERELQNERLSNDPQAKANVIKSILDELERVTANENK